ncbi:Eosinophil peroxidase [Merluccius polli]|uniref:Eosinophil peroxidase n=1 Tax=Merluccius polli TaxID=89951 RepID=A0AA47M7R8_MERPO|nr:Eosinophil peroxidase [Merluccius polli]
MAKVDQDYEYSRRASLARVRRDIVNPSDILRLMKQPVGISRSAVRASDYMDHAIQLLQKRSLQEHSIHKRSINATDLIDEDDLQTIADLTGCTARLRSPSCKTTPNLERFRTPTGECNNQYVFNFFLLSNLSCGISSKMFSGTKGQNAPCVCPRRSQCGVYVSKVNKESQPFMSDFSRKNLRLGASNTPFTRLLPPKYQDGFSLPIGWDPQKKINNYLLPLVRKVSNRILSTSNEDVESDPLFTHLVTIFGQWTDHDLTFTPHVPVIRSFNDGIDCTDTGSPEGLLRGSRMPDDPKLMKRCPDHFRKCLHM